jgi:hypothetical protein
VVEGPFARSVREALESVLSQSAGQLLIVEALRVGALERIPEEVGGFRVFCEGPFRRVVRANVAQASVEQIFERVAHVLWMATSDVTVMETARAWSQPGPNDRDGESGVRNVEVGMLGAAATATASEPRQRDSEPDVPSAHEAGPLPSRGSHPTPSATLGRMRAVSRASSAVASSEISSPMRDPRSESFELPAHVAHAVLPSAVLVVSLDTQLVAQIRQGLSQHAPVRAIGAASELVGSLLTSGDRLVVLIDTALPSIAVPTFAGLIPVLPASTRVVLWGANKRHLLRLNALYPDTARWTVSENAEDPVALLLTLP